MATRTNLCTNPRFGAETIAGWGSSGFSVTDGAGSGEDTYFTMTANGAGSMGMSSTITIADGDPLSIAAEVRNGAGTMTAQIRCRFYSSGGGAPIAEHLSVESPAPGEFGRVTLNGLTAPASAASATITMLSAAASAGNRLEVTRVLFEPASSAGSYFDGDSANAEWTGTPHASTSILTLPDTTRTLHPVLKIGSSHIGPMRVGERN